MSPSPDLQSLCKAREATVSLASNASDLLALKVAPVNNAIELICLKLSANPSEVISSDNSSEKITRGRVIFASRFFNYIKGQTSAEDLSLDPKRFLYAVEDSGLLRSAIVHFIDRKTSASIESSVALMQDLFKQLEKLFDFSSPVASDLLDCGSRIDDSESEGRQNTKRIARTAAPKVEVRSLTRYREALEVRAEMSATLKARCISTAERFVRFVIQELIYEQERLPSKSNDGWAKLPLDIVTIDEILKERGSDFVERFLKNGKKRSDNYARTCLVTDYLEGLRYGYNIELLPSLLEPLRAAQSLDRAQASQNPNLKQPDVWLLRKNQILSSIAEVHDAMAGVSYQPRANSSAKAVDPLTKVALQRDELISQFLRLRAIESESRQSVPVTLYAVLRMSWSGYSLIDKTIKIQTGEESRTAEITLDGALNSKLMLYKLAVAKLSKDKVPAGWGNSSVLFIGEDGAALVDDFANRQHARFQEFEAFRNQLVTSLVAELRVPFSLLSQSHRIKFANDFAWLQLLIDEKRSVTIDLPKLGVVGAEIQNLAGRFMNVVRTMLPSG